MTADWATIIVAGVALVSAIFSGRSASNASKYSTRTQAETEAYNRARAIDTATIERQEKELVKLRKKVEELDEDNEMLHGENEDLRRRVRILEETRSTDG
jgi:predicted RNase H-like nuclease (RuvC/YqgF family)